MVGEAKRKRILGILMPAVLDTVVMRVSNKVEGKGHWSRLSSGFYTCAVTWMCIHTHTLHMHYRNIHTDAHTYTYSHTYTKHTRILYTHTYTYANTKHVYTHKCICTQTHTHTKAHIYTHTYTAYIYTKHTHTHTYFKNLSLYSVDPFHPEEVSVGHDSRLLWPFPIVHG